MGVSFFKGTPPNKNKPKWFSLWVPFIATKEGVKHDLGASFGFRLKPPTPKQNKWTRQIEPRIDPTAKRLSGLFWGLLEDHRLHCGDLNLLLR